MPKIEFVAYGEAKPAGSKTAFAFKRKNGTLGATVVDACRLTKSWQHVVASAAMEVVEQMSQEDRYKFWDAPLEMTCHFYFPRPKNHYGTGKNSSKLKDSAPAFHTKAPDATKLVRAIEDSMQDVVYKNDASIVRPHPHKHYGEPARVEVCIKTLE